MEAVLVLTAEWTLSEIVSWQEAMSLILAEKAYMVAQYAGKVIHSVSEVFPFPAVIVRTTRSRRDRRIRFSRKNILARDFYTCAYCGAKPKKKSGVPDLQALTIDHVIPRAQSKDGWVTSWNGEKVRVTSWSNVVSSCSACNTAKGNRTPAQAGMTLRRRPEKPSRVAIAWMKLYAYPIPKEWETYLPEDSLWREYWTAELDPS